MVQTASSQLKNYVKEMKRNPNPQAFPSRQTVFATFLIARTPQPRVNIVEPAEPVFLKGRADSKGGLGAGAREGPVCSCL